MSRRRYAQNLDTYSTWRRSIDPIAEAKFEEKVKKSSKVTVFRVVLVSLAVVALASIITQLVAMSQFSTLGYEIERLQDQKAQLDEEADQLRTAIATYQTTKYYQQKALETAMVKPEKMVYLQINEANSDSKTGNVGSCSSPDSPACALADN